MYNHCVMRIRFLSGRLLAAATGVAMLIGLLELPRLSARSAPPQGSAPVIAASHTLTFDAASIKSDISGNGGHSLSVNLMGGRLRGVNVSLAQLMLAAYKVPHEEIVGTPPWFDSEYFDVEATHEAPGPDDPATDDGNQIRLQALLADRFRLMVHRETRQMPIYALVLSNPPKLGPNLHVNKEHCDTSSPTTKCSALTIGYGTTRVHYEGRNIPMKRFLLTLAGTPTFPSVDRPLVDETGITGNLDFSIEFAPLRIRVDIRTEPCSHRCRPRSRSSWV